jgi:uncharacterized protein YndB with AHSA1/START domain
MKTMPYAHPYVSLQTPMYHDKSPQTFASSKRIALCALAHVFSYCNLNTNGIDCIDKAMQKIKIETIINADSIKGWAFASDTWECPYAENDLRVGGRFLTRMSAKDGSESFDFTGTYTDVIDGEKIKYIMDKAENEVEHRECEVIFMDQGDSTTKVTEEFSPEQMNSEDLQRAGWGAILDNFKKFVDSH